MTMQATGQTILGNARSPKQWLLDAAASQSNYVGISCDRIHWSFYFLGGKPIYASHSVDPFERLERHLRRLSRDVTSLTEQVRSQARLLFDETTAIQGIPPEYQAVLWLVDEGFLPKTESSRLLARLVQEVIETFCCLPGIPDVEETYLAVQLPGLYSAFDVTKLLEFVDSRIKEWQALGPAILSPYQSPYLVSQSLASQHLPAEIVQRLAKLLRGFNFRQIAAMLGKNDLAVAKQLLPLIRNGAILLRDPASPLDLLPRTYHPDPAEDRENIQILSESFPEGDDTGMTVGLMPAKTKTWKIACVDDSVAMLSEIERLLDRDTFAVTPINDSMRALMKLASIRPDLILLDVGMPNVDGYQLCSLIRKASMLKDTPIVMVTGHKGFLDRARARVAGATDYLTKPFTESDLLKMVMRHLI